jgi:hypothetical protein
VASWDVLAWALRHPSFPNDSTSQQLYGDREFEAYRALGELAASAVLELFAKEKAEQERPKSTDVRRGQRVPAQTEPAAAKS